MLRLHTTRRSTRATLLPDKPHVDQFSRFGSAHQRDGHTDHATSLRPLWSSSPHSTLRVRCGLIIVYTSLIRWPNKAAFGYVFFSPGIKQRRSALHLLRAFNLAQRCTSTACPTGVTCRLSRRRSRWRANVGVRQRCKPSASYFGHLFV